MKKAIIILVISLLFMNNLDRVMPYSEMFKDNQYGELIDQCDAFYRINIKTNNSADLRETLNLLQHVLLENKLSFQIVDDNCFKDIKKNNWCNIYTSNTNGYNNVIMDMKLDIEGKGKTINNIEEKQMFKRLCDDIRSVLKEGFVKLDIKRNLRLKANNKFSILEVKDKVEEYLNKNNFEADSVDIYNGYSMKVKKSRGSDLAFQLSIIKYDNNNCILFGEPDIYISY